MDYSREKKDRTTKNKMERRMSMSLEKYWAKNGRGNGQDDMEKEDHQSYRRPYTMGKEKEDVRVMFTV